MDLEAKMLCTCDGCYQLELCIEAGGGWFCSFCFKNRIGD